MPLLQLFNFVRERQGRYESKEQLWDPLVETFSRTWYLGFTSFGGPPAHFGIFHDKFVDCKKAPWLDEQTYQELFALCQASPGPASTKFLFATTLIHAGWIPAILAFMLWSLPGAVGMFSLSLGIRGMGETLPEPAYALLSGLNASTVGIVAVAAVQLAEKCIKDHLSRILVIFGACAGLCYSALWYYPVLVAVGGLTAVFFDLWFSRQLRVFKQKWDSRRRQAADQAANAEQSVADSRHTHGRETIELQSHQSTATCKENQDLVQRRLQASDNVQPISHSASTNAIVEPDSAQAQQGPVYISVSMRSGILLAAAFVVSFIAIIVTRSQLPTENRPLSLFANMYLAGTIIFGGGPVVIPLLREYVVTPGWVSTRDFLIGLAIIQAFPGPNFNFSVYLGALALSGATTTQLSTSQAFLGALLGFVGIFSPGLIFAASVQGFWRKLRSKAPFLALLRGINATAVGLVFTAVYRLWEAGYLTNASTSASENADEAGQGGRVSGKSLADEPWWVVVAVVAYAGNKWFNVPAAGGIMIGGLLGLAWWGCTQR